VTGAGDAEIVIAHYNSNGVVLSAVSAGGPNTDLPAGLTIDSLGNLYLTANCRNSAYFGAIEITDANGAMIIVAKYNSNLVPLWAISGSSIAGSYGIAGATVDNSGNVYIIGNYTSLLSMTDTAGVLYEIPASINRLNIFYAKLDSDGKLSWLQRLASGSVTLVVSQISCYSNYIYIGGYYSGVMNVIVLEDVEYTSEINSFVLSMETTNGDPHWISLFSSGYKRLYGLYAANNGLLYTSGTALVQANNQDQFFNTTMDYDVFVAVIQTNDVPLNTLCVQKSDLESLLCDGGTRCTTSCICESDRDMYGDGCNYSVTLLSNIPTSGVLKRKDTIKLSAKLSGSMNDKSIVWFVNKKNDLSAYELTSYFTDKLLTRVEQNAPVAISSSAFESNTEYSISMAVIDSSKKLLYVKSISVTYTSDPPELIQTPSGKIGFFYTKLTDRTLIETYPRYLLTATNWRARSFLLYSFEYYDEDMGWIPLSTISEMLIATVKLPFGTTESGDVTVRVLVSNEYGETSTYSTAINNPKPAGFSLSIDDVNKDIRTSSDNIDTSFAAITRFVREKSISVTNDDLEQYQTLVSLLLDKSLSALTNNTDVVEYTKSLLLRLTTVDLLTKTNNTLSSEGSKTALSIIRELLYQSYKLQDTSDTLYSSLCDDTSFQKMADIISNVAKQSYNDDSSSKQTLSAATDLANEILNGLLQSESQSFATQNFQLKVFLDKASQLDSSQITVNDSSVTIPLAFSNDIQQSGILRYVMLVFDPSVHPYSWKEQNDTSSAPTALIDLKFQNINGTILPLRNLTEPLILNFTNIAETTRTVKKYECRYWDEELEQWSTDGCYLVNSTLDSIICKYTTIVTILYSLFFYRWM
jgi:hypothetical protein